MDKHNRVSRRLVLGGLAGTAGAAALAACSPEGGSGGSGGGGNGGGGGSDGWTPPNFVPFEGVEPDLPGTEDGVSPAFFSYPNPPMDREGFPLPQTDDVTALLQGVPPPTAPDQNPAYEVFRAQAGNKMAATTITSADYLNRYQVVLASDDIPDFVQMSTVPQFPKLLESTFTDLTDILGGEGVENYPGLANIPTPTWDIPKVNGRLWGIAQPRPPAGRILSARGDLLAEKGIDKNPDINSGEDFVDLLAELTDRGNNQFAMGADPAGWLLPGLLEMMEAPNDWALEGDTYVSVNESPQMAEALNEGAKIIKAGYLHPNSFSDPSQNATWWNGGVTSMYFQAFTGWGVFARGNPDWDLGYVRLPKWGGGGKAPLWKSVAGYGAFIAIKKQSSDERLEELLKLADFVASPFGTQQFLDVNYGAEGTHYEMKDGNPEFLPDQSANIVAGWGYLGGNSQAILFVPGQDELVQAQHEYLTETIPTGVSSAALGLYSETAVSKGSSWNQRLTDMKREVLRGAKSVSDWEKLVADWKSAVGEAIAGEYAEAAAG